MSEPNQLPPAAVIITHEVADWTTWKTHFDGHESTRKAAGFLGHHINRGLENPNVISVYLAVADLAKAKAFFASADLRNVTAAAGVKGAPTAVWVKPVTEQIVWDREVPAMIVSHNVANFDTWLATYKATVARHEPGGIIGRAANQSLDDSTNVVVYHQAESHDTLKAFMASPGLKEAMQTAGVTSAPQVTYVTGGWAKRY
jgi:quinol monooxygenase YgiN